MFVQILMIIILFSVILHYYSDAKDHKSISETILNNFKNEENTDNRKNIYSLMIMLNIAVCHLRHLMFLITFFGIYFIFWNFI